MYINAIDEDDDKLGFGAVSQAIPNDGTVHVKELADSERMLIQATESAALSQIPSMDSKGAPSLDGRVESVDLASNNQRIQEVVDDLAAQAANIETATIESAASLINLNLNPALEIVNLGLLKERQVDDQLQDHIKTIERHQKNVNLLIKLNTALTAHKEGQPLSDEILSLVAQLKEEKIDLLKEGETTLSKERITELKPVISSHTDNLRTAIQIAFTTQIQVLTNMIGLIMDILKKTIDYNNKLLSTANRLPGH